MEVIDKLKIFDDNLIKELDKLATNKIEYWDIKSGVGIGTSLDFTDQKSKEISSYELIECGIRTFVNGGWGFNVIKDLSKNSIKNGFINAIKLAKLSESMCKNKFKIKERDPLIKNFKIDAKKKIDDVSIEDKIEQVKVQEKTASNYSSEIKNTHTIYMDGHGYNLFINSVGSYIYQDLS
ncbi:MAG: PmbA/TldA family metallopeptidase, partial [Candidatus Hermodarchaeota archaeon]